MIETEADLAAQERIASELKQRWPEIAFLGEEMPADRQARLLQSDQPVWCLDPLDGTKEFLARTGEFTINIALVDGHRPVLGVIYLPLEEVAYVGIPGVGAHSHHFEEGGWRRRVLGGRKLEQGRPLKVLASAASVSTVSRVVVLEDDRPPFC